MPSKGCPYRRDVSITFTLPGVVYMGGGWGAAQRPGWLCGLTG
jgi:hypothetical protein